MNGLSRLNTGLGFLLIILIIQFLVRLPFNLSVLCFNVNEGFYFVFGKLLLDGKQIESTIGPFFLLTYCILIKMFGFGAWAIVASHFLQTLLVILNCLLLYVLSNILFQSNLFAGITVLLYTLIQLTFIGYWGITPEFFSVLALEAEHFIVFFSLASVSLFLFSLFNDRNKLWISYALSIISGILAVVAGLFKASGFVLIISIFCWFLYLLVFETKLFQTYLNKLFLFMLGALLVLICFSYYLGFSNIANFFREYFATGMMYVNKPITLPELLYTTIWTPIIDSTFAVGNIFFFLFLLISLLWCFVKYVLIRSEKENIRLPFLLILIWGVGNFCAVLAPALYAPYYYVLFFPASAFFITFLVKDIVSSGKIPFFRRLKLFIIIVLISLFLFVRLVKIMPVVFELAKEYISYSFFYQPQSFQDPVAPYDMSKSNRPSQLYIADYINSLLPDTKDTFYVFNLARGSTTFSPTLYLYAKRLPPTSVFSDYLYYEKHYIYKEAKLIRDLTNIPPKILVLPRTLRMKDPKQQERIRPFLKWVKNYVLKNYHFQNTIQHLREQPARVAVLYDIYRKKQ